MAKSIFNGVLSFGLVSAPFKLYVATENQDISLNLLHTCKQQGRIRHKNFCETCETAVEFADIQKGYEYEKGKYVTFSTDELAELNEVSDKVLEIVQFVELEEVDPIYFEKAYFLGADKGGERALGLLAYTLKATKKAALGRVTLRNREHLVLIRSGFGGLVMHTLLYTNEVRQNDEKLASLALSDAEKGLAGTLITALTNPVDLTIFQNGYVDNLQKLIDSKVKGKGFSIKKTAKAKPQLDLMDSLKESLEAAKKRAGKKSA
jgi:DNA end-binding protein Ku